MQDTLLGYFSCNKGVGEVRKAALGFMAVFSICVSRRERMRRLRIFVLLMPAFVLLVVYVPRALTPVTRLNSDFDSNLDMQETLLLVWWAPFGNKRTMPDSCKNYGVHGCVVTLDRREYGRADAVIMHHRDLVREQGALPKPPRPEGQKWIWMNFESPSHSRWLEGLDGVFNLTMSYHLGSDIFLPYGYLQRRHPSSAIYPLNNEHGKVRRHRAIDDHILVDHNGKANGRNEIHDNDINLAGHHHGNDKKLRENSYGNNFTSEGDHQGYTINLAENRSGNDNYQGSLNGRNIHLPLDHHGNNSSSHYGNYGNAIPVQRRNGRTVRRRRALVAWVISNWNEDQERVQFYWRLRRYIRVDIYGHRALRLVNDNVLQTISGYKFYLAFENSLHTDYITEKLWRNALQSGAVPVVLGPPRENYERFLPPDAFIHANDFKSPRALAAYLMYLDRHPAQYNRYMAWRHDYIVHVTSFWAEHYCAACRAVQASHKQRKTIKHLGYWFWS